MLDRATSKSFDTGSEAGGIYVFAQSLPLDGSMLARELQILRRVASCLVTAVLSIALGCFVRDDSEAANLFGVQLGQ